LEEARATLKLRDANIARLTKLVQEAVSFEELRDAGEEKEVTILELQQAAETACAALETEKKQVEGESPLLNLCLPIGFVEIRSRLICFFAFRPADGSQDVSDAGGGAPGGLQLLPARTGGSAGGSPRSMPERR
jgi:hypothetical protein